ncbi:MAG TPA: hypothetical protein VJ743_16965 [Albitalea sp.]|nr:hypothetical protein [Albitalea sp.]
MTPATDELIDGPLITLPPEAGDVNAPRFEPAADWLRRATPEQQMTAMWRWFATRYETPETAVPHDEQGEYVYVDGGPWLADEVLHERFDACVPEQVVERLVQRVQQKAGNEWARRRIEEAGAGG